MSRVSRSLTKAVSWLFTKAGLCPRCTLHYHDASISSTSARSFRKYSSYSESSLGRNMCFLINQRIICNNRFIIVPTQPHVRESRNPVKLLTCITTSILGAGFFRDLMCPATLPHVVLRISHVVSI